MDADEIEAFLTLAEELHFGRTAERMHLGQARVSRLIASLERHVGGVLFERTSRRVTLTPLGVELRDRTAPAWSALQAGLAHARECARGTGGRLRIACTSITSGSAVSRLVEAFCAVHPDCEVTVHEAELRSLYAGLRDGTIDVLVNWQAIDEPDLVAGPVLEYRDRVLAMGSGHRLAGRESVSAEDLATVETVMPLGDGKLPAALAEAITPSATPAGTPVPRHPRPMWSVEDLIAVLARTDLVHPTMAGIALLQRAEITLVPIRDLPPMPLGLIWHAAHENARIRALAATARRLRDHRPAGSGPMRPPGGAARRGAVASSGERASTMTPAASRPRHAAESPMPASRGSGSPKPAAPSP